METRYLGRDDAPIQAETWRLLDETMVAAAKGTLAGRRLLDIEGPYGLGLKAVPLEDCEVSECLLVSRYMPVHMISTSFSLGVRDLVAYEQNGLPFALTPLIDAAVKSATLEDTLIFQGAPGAPGLLNTDGAGTQKMGSWNTVGKAADDVIKAMITLDESGYHGPYALALAPARYNLLFRRYLQGVGTELEHIMGIITGGVFKAPALKSGGVLLATGKQYASIVLGQDMTTGFIGPMGDRLEFSISESLALVIRQPGAICKLAE